MFSRNTNRGLFENSKFKVGWTTIKQGSELLGSIYYGCFMQFISSAAIYKVVQGGNGVSSLESREIFTNHDL